MSAITDVPVFLTRPDCRLALVLLVATAAINPVRAEQSPLHYRLSTDTSLEHVSVVLCFDSGAAPATLVGDAALFESISTLVATTANGTEKTLLPTANRVRLPAGQGGCVNWTVSLPRTGEGDRRAAVHRHNGAVVVALDRLLLRPGHGRRWHDTRLEFQLPDGVAVSAPGQREDHASAAPVFRLLDRPYDWHGDVVLGRLTQREVERGGANLRITVVGEATAATAATLGDWVDTGAAALTGVYGRFPVRDVQVLVFPLAPSDDPVPWGEVVRGGGDAVHLYVDGTRSLAELNANWVLCHELSHLLHPYVTSGGSWLPEGIASYYQNVSRARARIIEPHVAWAKLAAGFERGRRQTTGKRTLAQATGAMLARGEYMRVYWSGAAIALIADVELRRRSGGTASLDTVLDELARCCLPTERRWRPAELMSKMDKIAGTEVFMRLYERYVRQPVFPDTGATFRTLGLGNATPGGDAQARDLRRAIMGAD